MASGRCRGTAGAPEQLIAVEEGEVAHGPQMLPGGEWVLFTLRPAGTSTWDEAQIVVESVTTAERVVLIQGGRDARYVPTGHLVYVLNGVVLAVGFDLDARQVIGGSVPLVEGVTYATNESNSGAAHFSLADNGSLVYVPGATRSGAFSSLVWVGRTGQGGHRGPAAWVSSSAGLAGRDACGGGDSRRRGLFWASIALSWHRLIRTGFSARQTGIDPLIGPSVLVT